MQNETPLNLMGPKVDAQENLSHRHERLKAICAQALHYGLNGSDMYEASEACAAGRSMRAFLERGGDGDVNQLAHALELLRRWENWARAHGHDIGILDDTRAFLLPNDASEPREI